MAVCKSGAAFHTDSEFGGLGKCGERGGIPLGMGGWADSLDDLGGDRFAGCAPRGEAVEDHEAVLFGHGVVEFLLAV